MANLVNYVIPNLIQGVSQQPDAQRDPSQGEKQINGMSSIAEGLRKRDCTVTLAKVSDSNFGDAFFHSILRDQQEQYLSVITKDKIQVFGLDGTEYDVIEADSSAYDYLGTVTSAKSDLRAVTIADYTFVSNLRQLPKMDGDKWPEDSRPANECLIWVKQANYGQTYRVNINGTEVTVETAVAPVVAAGGSVQTNRISSEEIAQQIMRGFIGGEIKSSGGLSVVAAEGTLDGTTDELTTITDNGGTGLTVKVTVDGSKVTAVAIENGGAGYLKDDSIKVLKKSIMALDSEGEEYDGDDADDEIEIATVADTEAAPGTDLQMERQGSVVWVKSDKTITIEATDARANTDITAILDKVQVFTELPTISPIGYQVEIEGDPGNSFDNYYVAFEPRSGDFNEGSWLETVKPGLVYKINGSTMPHLLVRQPDDDFWFGPADGRKLEADDKSWEVEIPNWGQRNSGDEDTAKLPTFLANGGSAISDIGIYKNRLYFLSDEAIILSRAGDFFEFFPTTVTNVLDDDPIDIVASNNRVSVLRYAVPYQDELILFADQYQFRFNSADTGLTPSTAQITVLTQFEVDSALRPIQAGGGIIFGQRNDEWERVREFSVRGAGTALTADAADLTSYISTFVPKDVYTMTGNDTGNMVFMISNRKDAGPFGTDFRKRIYVYKYFYRNQGQQIERAQSSWSYWEFGGATQVLQVLCIEEELYMLVLYGDQVYLEKMSVTDRLSSDDGSPYPLLLDRRTDNTSATPATLRVDIDGYDKDKKTTKVTIKYTPTKDIEIWSGFNMAYDKDDDTKTWLGPKLVGTIKKGETSAECDGDWEHANLFCGEAYTFHYRFTRFKLVKEIGGGRAATNSTRTQVRKAALRYHETGYFKAVTKPENRQRGEYVFDATEIAVRASSIGNPPMMHEDPARFYEGVFNIPIMSRGEQCIVEIENDKPHPCKFSTCEWIGLLTGRSRPLQ